MPKISKNTASATDYGPVAEWAADLDGYRASFLTYKEADQDDTPLLKGLPDDLCQCPHWGYVVRGRFRVRYGGREEIVTAGDAYHIPPGHVSIYEEDTEVVEFSPKHEYQTMLEAVAGNWAAVEAARAAG